jgi:uroporphyrinogen decarboxylase
MNSRERVLTALRCQQPDRVPYCELGIDRALAQKLMGWGPGTSQAANLETNTYTVTEARALAAHLALDNLCYVLRAPVYAQKIPGMDGRLFYGEGMIRSRADLPLLQLPDPHDEAMYADAEAFLSERGDYSTWFVTRMGIFATMLGMGTEAFSLALFEDRPLVEEILDRYVEWAMVVAERACRMGFDVYVTTDDMAFKTAPFFSPKVFRQLVMPRYRRLREKVTLPWIIHSDGNLLPFMDDLASLGIAGIHPNEKGAMDPRVTKQRYGARSSGGGICVLGNVDLNLLGMAAPEEVDEEVRSLIRDLGPDGGYIVTSGNSLAGYLIPENVLALSRAVQKYGKYPM